MEAFLAALMESLGSGAAPMDEAVASGGMAPPSAMDSFGAQLGTMAGQEARPTMDFYNTMTNHNATGNDMMSGAWKYAMSGENSMMNPYSKPDQQNKMGGNYLSGIPSLLQGNNASQGILQYLAR
jgi:hypothetical protein